MDIDAKAREIVLPYKVVRHVPNIGGCAPIVSLAGEIAAALREQAEDAAKDSADKATAWDVVQSVHRQHEARIAELEVDRAYLASRAARLECDLAEAKHKLGETVTDSTLKSVGIKIANEDCDKAEARIAVLEADMTDIDAKAREIAHKFHPDYMCGLPACESNMRALVAEHFAYVASIEAERDELRELLDMQWRRDMDAVSEWRKERPERDLSLPDRGNLMLHVLDRAEAAEADKAKLVTERDDAVDAAVLAEREACAGIAETKWAVSPNGYDRGISIAAALRARGET